MKTAKEILPTRDPSMLVRKSGTDNEAGYSSPPCFMHELDPSYFGYWSRDEVLALLNQLLEGERAGARSVGAMSEQAAGAQARTVLR